MLFRQNRSGREVAGLATSTCVWSCVWPGVARYFLVIFLLFSRYFLCVVCVRVGHAFCFVMCVLVLFVFVLFYFSFLSHHITSRHITSHHITSHHSLIHSPHSFTHLLTSTQLTSHHMSSFTHSLTHSLTHPCVAASKVTLYIICVCQLQDVQA